MNRGVTMKVLLTGFEPFGGDEYNPSQSICEALSGYTTERCEIHTCILPVSFLKAPAVIRQAMNALRPDIALSLGYSSKATCFLLERVALNLEDARIADNDKYQPEDALVEPGNVLAMETTLPVRSLETHLKNRGIPAQLSYTAGTFVCNTVFYTLLSEGQSKGYPRRAGFIHVPALPEMAAGKRDQPFLPLAYMVSGIREVIGYLCHATE